MSIVNGLIITWASIFFCSFLLFRLFSPFAKTYWKNDLMIAIAPSIIITALLKVFILQ